MTDIRVETVDHGMEILSAAHPWIMLTSAAPPVGALVATRTEEQRVAVRHALDGMVRERAAGGPAVLNMQVHIGIGTK
jgi:hypothetical protein